MRRCVQLAKNGLGTSYPNPLVGSVIVHNNMIIGEGWHYKSGMAHAEVNAIKSVSNPELLKDSTIYVSLEPCSHFGKTPPCSDLIIATGIKKVVIGSMDPNPKVAGRGIKKLTEAGCDVQFGVLIEDSDQLNKRFFTYHKKKRPFIILKWAQTKDGFIAPASDLRSKKEPVWITNTIAIQLSHKLRAEEQAILVGTQTVIDDNPSLTTREWKGSNPLRVVIDRTLRIPEDAFVFSNDAATFVVTEKEMTNRENIIYETLNFSENIPQQLCKTLYNHNIQSIIIEGGATTLQSFIDTNLWDEALVFTGNSIFENGIKAPQLAVSASTETVVLDNYLHTFINQNS
ncbi:bifunctional diaminohydroxyphosphoribosylaminopyrimidine deaminase/5-amino-6-(5-phosphoribosylamino)uracil reductase RibD [Ulvibacter antarcticus]|uniref:Riboflavin biosynthesis protein RibD n=1 Tax=Ulvibacter antarcticus TaxID=442714 RepID=A0A3L9ZE16_9FLAO|nr:diaminohydroxyphosphoribosylaminopyrimidine deaminase [Ulvibacter antarcticus]